MAEGPKFSVSEDLFSSKRFKVEWGFLESVFHGNVIRLTVRGQLVHEPSVNIWVDDPSQIADELTAIAALIRVKVRED